MTAHDEQPALTAPAGDDELREQAEHDRASSARNRARVVDLRAELEQARAEIERLRNRIDEEFIKRHRLELIHQRAADVIADGKYGPSARKAARFILDGPS